MDIVELTKDQYKGYKVNMDYVSDYYYKVIIDGSEDKHIVSFIKSKFDFTFNKKTSSTLFEDHWELPSAYGMFDKEKLIAVIEINREVWSNRLRVTNIAVSEKYKRKGLGKKLMSKVKEIAREEEFRMIILETQTSNSKAIDFYKSEGFILHGFDGSCYSNDDIIKNEVRMEWIYLIK